MRRLIKILCAFLALLLTIVGSAGCNSSQSDGENSESSSQIQSDTESSAEHTDKNLVLASDGESEFIIVVDSDYYKNTDLKNKISEIVDYIKQKTGAQLKITTDRAVAKQEDRDKPAILIGPTSFAESVPKDAPLRLYDYYIQYVGNKIVVYSEYVEGAMESLLYFKSILADQTVTDKTLYFDKEFQKLGSGHYNINSILCDGNQLSSYSIVIPKNASTNEGLFAYKLRYYLATNYGYVIPVIADDTAASGNEILVGSARQYVASVAANNYAIELTDSDLRFFANDMAGYLGMYSYIENTLFSTEKDEYALDNGYKYSAKATGSLNDGTQLLTERSGDARVMLYNCLGMDNVSQGAMFVRHPIQAAIIGGYVPDVIGFQEYTPYCYTNLSPILEAQGYTWLETSAGKSDYTPIFYRSDKVTPVEFGYFCYSGANNSNSKSATWCVFKDNSTERQFGVISTHFMYNAPSLTADQANETRKSNATELVALISEILSKYPELPLVAGGDLNSRIGQDPHAILSDSGLVHAHDIAETKNDVRTHGYGATYDEVHHTHTEIPKAGAGYASSIDHAYATEQTSIATFCTLVDPYSLATSDHMPLLIDINLE